MKDVTLLAVGVRQQRDARRAVRIVLDRNHRRRHTGLVALEVDRAQLALVPSAAVPDGDVAGVAPPAGAQLDAGQRLVRLVRRQLVVGQRRLKTQRRRYWSVCLNSHKICLQLLAIASCLHTLTNSARTPASSRQPSNAHTPFSSPDRSEERRV